MPMALAALVALLLAMPALAEEPAAVDAVQTRFDWPVGLAGSVSSTRSRTRTIEGKPKSTSATSHYAFRVGRQGEHLRIHVLEPVIEPDDGAEAAAPGVGAILAEAANLLPDTIVSTEGEFVAVHDVADYRRRLRAFLAKLLPEDFDSATLDSMLERITSEPMLNASSAEEWNGVVGAWVGADLELGEAYVSESREPAPLMPGAEILMNYTFSATRRLPCERAGAPRQCVEFELRSIADPGDTQRMIEKLLAEFSAEQQVPPLVFRTLQVENVMRLVTEPDGMIPHRFESLESMRATGEAAGEPMTIEQRNEATTVYTYTAP